MGQSNQYRIILTTSYGAKSRVGNSIRAAQGIVNFGRWDAEECLSNRIAGMDSQNRSSPRRRRARTGDKWHLDEVFLKINGATHYLWRAVDQNGVVLDILVQPKRYRFAAMRFFRRLLAAAPWWARVIVTDKLRSYAAAKGMVMPGVAHRQHSVPE